MREKLVQVTMTRLLIIVILVWHILYSIVWWMDVPVLDAHPLSRFRHWSPFQSSFCFTSRVREPSALNAEYGSCARRIRWAARYYACFLIRAISSYFHNGNNTATSNCQHAVLRLTKHVSTMLSWSWNWKGEEINDISVWRNVVDIKLTVVFKLPIHNT